MPLRATRAQRGVGIDAASVTTAGKENGGDDYERGPCEGGPGGRRVCWSNVQVNLLFEDGTIGHLTGSYDAGGSYGLESLELVGSAGRFLLLDACEHLTFSPRTSRQTETYDYPGNMRRSRITSPPSTSGRGRCWRSSISM